MSINLDRIVALSQTVEVTDTDQDGYTAYAIAGLINQTFKQLGVDSEVTPHYIYNESRNGKIDGVKHVAGEKVRFTEEQVTLYAAKFVAKHTRVTNAVETKDDGTGWDGENPEGDLLETDEDENNTEADES